MNDNEHTTQSLQNTDNPCIPVATVEGVTGLGDPRSPRKPLKRYPDRYPRKRFPKSPTEIAMIRGQLNRNWKAQVGAAKRGVDEAEWN